MKDVMDLEPVTTLKWWEKSLGDKIVIVNAQVIYPNLGTYQTPIFQSPTNTLRQ